LYIEDFDDLSLCRSSEKCVDVSMNSFPLSLSDIDIDMALVASISHGAALL